jgi:glutathione S-transferase
LLTVADAYLLTVLNWSMATPVDLTPWPTIVAYHSALHQRPSVARAFADERDLYVRELARSRSPRTHDASLKSGACAKLAP